MLLFNRTASSFFFGFRIPLAKHKNEKRHDQLRKKDENAGILQLMIST
jgi:hypothetical protein